MTSCGAGERFRWRARTSDVSESSGEPRRSAPPRALRGSASTAQGTGHWRGRPVLGEVSHGSAPCRVWQARASTIIAGLSEAPLPRQGPPRDDESHRLRLVWIGSASTALECRCSREGPVHAEPAACGAATHAKHCRSIGSRDANGQARWWGRPPRRSSSLSALGSVRREQFGGGWRFT